VRKEM